jgi:hypothetical protein
MATPSSAASRHLLPASGAKAHPAGKALPWQNTWRFALDGFVVIAAQLRIVQWFRRFMVR